MEGVMEGLAPSVRVMDGARGLRCVTGRGCSAYQVWA
jgi:hypothetical protein